MAVTTISLAPGSSGNSLGRSGTYALRRRRRARRGTNSATSWPPTRNSTFCDARGRPWRRPAASSVGDSSTGSSRARRARAPAPGSAASARRGPRPCAAPPRPAARGRAAWPGSSRSSRLEARPAPRGSGPRSSAPRRARPRRSISLAQLLLLAQAARATLRACASSSRASVFAGSAAASVSGPSACLVLARVEERLALLEAPAWRAARVVEARMRSSAWRRPSSARAFRGLEVERLVEGELGLGRPCPPRAGARPSARRCSSRCARAAGVGGLGLRRALALLLAVHGAQGVGVEALGERLGLGEAGRARPSALRAELLRLARAGAAPRRAPAARDLRRPARSAPPPAPHELRVQRRRLLDRALLLLRLNASIAPS